MFLSFIVPVYKTEKYLERCVKSLLEQDIDDYEILLIDDGSPDDSGVKCDELSAWSDKIIVFHKVNEGLGLTRNFGISHAKGDYIIFIDSDDYFKINALRCLKEHIEQEKSDIVVYGYMRVRDGIAVKRMNERFPDNNQDISYSNKDLASMCIGEPLKRDIFEVGPAWKEMWRKGFLINNRLIFPSERVVLSEDYPFATRAFFVANKVSYFDDILYYYCYNAASLTNTYNPDRSHRAINFYKMMESIIAELDLGDDASFRNNNNFMVNMLQCFKHTVFDENKLSEKILRIMEICDDDSVKKVTEKIERFDTMQMRLLHWLIKHRLCFFIYFVIRIRYR